MATKAGDLRERLTFSVSAAGSADAGDQEPDEYGNVTGGGGAGPGYVEQFEVDARVRPRLGGEEVLAARLAGRNVVAITVRYSTKTAKVTSAWVARDRAGKIYNIRTAVPDERKRWVEMLAELGVAA